LGEPEKRYRLTEIDVVPHIAARETHERPREFSVINPKGLFQHNLP
jgi:hypothetical protein